MAKRSIIIAVFVLFAVCVSACNRIYQPLETTEHTETEQTAADTTGETIEATTVETTCDTESEHSPLYIEGLAVEDVIRYFNEVCLDAEFVNGGNASLLQKWTKPIYYMCNGSATEEDLQVLANFVSWLNTIEGFPGMYETQVFPEANLQIHFCSSSDMVRLLGENFSYMDGGVTFWYDNNEIYNAIICCRTDIHQTVRNSVILEEIYNGLGPIQDTQLRQDSIIFSGYSEPQSLTEVDELLIKLLYNPQIQCGMNADECETIIRRLYY
ncbi:MAG: DUF2927 domain-containing protein [Oscillospiraceae bacterium]|nr:DUF2927 domain-containing protein [Oscillospiraceae bacterium]